MARLAIDAREGELGGVQERLAAGDDINQSDGPDDRTAIHEAATAGHLHIVEYLLQHGAHACALSKSGNTPLHLGAWCGHVPVIEALLVHGADARATTKSGNTPLHWAARFGHARAAELLLHYGADPLAMNKDGKLARDLASAAVHLEVLRVLQSDELEVPQVDCVPDGLNEESLSHPSDQDVIAVDTDHPARSETHLRSLVLKK
mmetsp:Transcript_48196/g.92129  ORF Transcript_48196/g.92129 Transcript_48196/m.92129 type:complete len:205 (-) Transcript_48196:124-738(-)